MRYASRTALAASVILVVLASAGDRPWAGSTSQRRQGSATQKPTGGAPAPQVGGASCTSPTVISNLPYSDSDNTCGANATVSDYRTPFCDPLAQLPPNYRGPELIYQILLGDDNQIQISLTTGPVYDGALFLLDSCGDGGTCVGGLDICENPPGQPELCQPPTGQLTEIVAPGQRVDTEVGEIEYPPIDSGSYYIFVDSYYGSPSPSSCGDYTLTVTGIVPVELLKFHVD